MTTVPARPAGWHSRRMLEQNPDDYLTATMRELTDEIKHDREVLDAIIERLGHSPKWGQETPAAGAV